MLMSFIGAFLGAFFGCLTFLYFVPRLRSGQLAKQVQSKQTTDDLKLQSSEGKPKGVVLKSPTPDEERARKMKEFEAVVYRPKEEIITDYRPHETV